MELVVSDKKTDDLDRRPVLIVDYKGFRCSIVPSFLVVFEVYWYVHMMWEKQIHLHNVCIPGCMVSRGKTKDEL